MNFWNTMKTALRGILGIAILLMALLVIIMVLVNLVDNTNKNHDIVVGGIHYVMVVRNGHSFLMNVTMDSLAVQEYNMKLLMGQLASYPFVTSKNTVEDYYKNNKVNTKSPTRKRRR